MTTRTIHTIAGGLALALTVGSASAEPTDLGQVTDINNGGLSFDPGAEVFSFGLYAFDEEVALDGNDALAITQDGVGSFNDGAGISLHISNGENGDAMETNTEPADSVFTTIGNASGRLENGNVIRASLWVRQDPNDPITAEPQIEPVLKLEFWQLALGTTADFTGGVPNPGFGDRIFDTDQNGGAGSWVDMNNDGDASFGNPVGVSAVTDEWRQIVQVYEVDDSNWGILDQGTKTVEDVEEIRPVIFVGDFEGRDLTGGGTLLADNFLVEVFADASAEAASDVTMTNPVPSAVMVVTGDADGDGDVDAFDLGIWQTQFGQTGDDLTADFDDDGDVDAFDLGLWQTNFGTGLGAAVPEPATFGLLSLATATLLRRRR